MLKPCKVTYYVSVDGSPMRKLWTTEYKLTQHELPNSFEMGHLFEHIINGGSRAYAPDIYTDTTLFRKRPYAEINYNWDCSERYYGFKEIRIKECEEPWENATLKDIHDCSSADQFIQYLKERGITTCSMNF